MLSLDFIRSNIGVLFAPTNHRFFPEPCCRNCSMEGGEWPTASTLYVLITVYVCVRACMVRILCVRLLFTPHEEGRPSAFAEVYN